MSEVGTRGHLVTFASDPLTMPFDTSLFIIIGQHRVYLCDTHLGPDSMQEVSAEINRLAPGKPLIVFTSHSDYDHVWGNCFFDSSTPILAHDRCYEEMALTGAMALEFLASQQRGNVTLRLPSMTFSKRLTFRDDEVTFFYAPGHTEDSACCFDERDGVLFVGDLVEEPIPFLGWHDLDRYLTTLELVIAHEAQTIISAHSGIIDRDLIRRNMDYICAVKNKKEPDFTDEASTATHAFNLKSIRMSRVKDDLLARGVDRSIIIEFFRRMGPLMDEPFDLFEAGLREILTSIEDSRDVPRGFSIS